MDAWGIQIVLLSLFKENVEGLKAGPLYQLFTGTEADNLENNRTPSPIAPHLSIARGLIDETFYSVTVQQGRIDFQVARPDRPLSGPWAWKLAEGIKRATDARSKVLTLLRNIGATNRLAVNMTLLRNVTSAMEAAQFIADHIENPTLGDCTDILFQFNRAMPSGALANVRLNRLMRFATSALQELKFGLGSGGPQAMSMVSERHVATLMLDFNTVPSERVFTHEESGALLSELLADAGQPRSIP